MAAHEWPSTALLGCGLLSRGHWIGLQSAPHSLIINMRTCLGRRCATLAAAVRGMSVQSRVAEQGKVVEKLTTHIGASRKLAQNLGRRFVYSFLPQLPIWLVATFGR